MNDASLIQALNDWKLTLTHNDHTIKAYTNDVIGFIQFLTHHFGQSITLLVLATVTHQDIRSWLADRRTRYHMRSTQRAFSANKQFFRYLKQKGYLASNPFLNINLPKSQKPLPRPLSIDQAKTTIRDVSQDAQHTWIRLRDQALCLLLYSVGLRISEALNLNQECLTASMIQILGKGSKYRMVPLLDSVKDHLKAYLEQCPYPQGETYPLFYGAQGKRMNASIIRKTLQLYRTTHHLPKTVTPHAFRHSCATHILNNTTDIRALQDLLGHTSLSTTQRYVDIQQEKIYKQYSSFHPRSKPSSSKKSD